MKFYTKRFILWLLSLAIVMFVTASYYHLKYQNVEEIVEHFGKMNSVMSQFEELYIDDVNWDEMVDYGLYAMITASGDKYGTYFDKESFSAYALGNQGKIVGIGVSAIYDEEVKGIKIVEIFENSPAQQAGIKIGDIITAVDGKSVEETGYYIAIKNVRGDEGSEAELKILRDGKSLDIKVMRKTMDLPSVKWRMLDGDIGYIRFIEFHDKTPQEFKLALEDTKGAKGYIFDVRNNTGGELNSILSVLDTLLPEGKIVTLRDNQGSDKVYRSNPDEINLPMAVLINENTYSAAELFAAALKDYDKAKLIGIKTYGKGVSQSVVPFKDGSAMTVTSSKFYPPSDISFNEIGVTPHIEVDLPEELKNKYDISDSEDTQLMAALKLLKK